MAVNKTRISSAQMEEMVSFMEKHPTLTKKKLANGFNKEKDDELWRVLTKKLNVLGGARKTEAKWRRTWSDLKCSVKDRASKQVSETICTETGLVLSSIDERIIKLIKNSTNENLRELSSLNSPAERNTDEEDTNSPSVFSTRPQRTHSLSQNATLIHPIAKPDNEALSSQIASEPNPMNIEPSTDSQSELTGQNPVQRSLSALQKYKALIERQSVVAELQLELVQMQANAVSERQAAATERQAAAAEKQAEAFCMIANTLEKLLERLPQQL